MKHHVKDATRKSKVKSVQNKKGATRKKCYMKRVQDEESAQRKKGEMRKKAA